MAEHFFEPLTEERLLEGVAVLTAQDADLAAVVHRWGPPPLWAREPGFQRWCILSWSSKCRWPRRGRPLTACWR